MARVPRFARLADAPDWVRNYYRLRLDIEFRSVRGEAFQRLFDKVMRSIHGSDYRPTASLGARGDEGCDGWLSSRKIVFACYGPDPYFKLASALSKMNDDFAKAVAAWAAPSRMREWIFVINYPAPQPRLLQRCADLEAQHPGLTARVWGRQDILEQFLLWGRRSTLEQEFGPVPSHSQSTGRAFVVPEGTALPRREAGIYADMVRSRMACDRAAWETARHRWFDAVAQDPINCLTVQTQFLIGAIAAPTMAELLDPERVNLTRLLRESEISRGAWSRHGKRAWNLAMSIITSAGPDASSIPPTDPIGDDLEKLLSTIAAGDRLVHGLIRMYSRDSGDLETECLDDVWHYVSTIRIHE